MAVNEPKQTKKNNKTPDPVITDLNMTVAQLKMSGLNNTQIAKRLGLGLPAITYHLQRFNNLINLNKSGDIDDPVNSHRARLQANFKKHEQVYREILKPGSKKKGTDGWKTNHERLKLAKDTAIALDKGLGVLRERTEHKVESFEAKRLTVVNRLELAQQYGADIPEAIQADYEIIPDTHTPDMPDTPE